jgi:phospholipid/cholesterol/gamma-HCH transport system substrate-binding protein
VLELGHSTTLYANRDTLIGGEKAVGMLDKAQEMLPEVMALLPKIDSILVGLNDVVNHTGLQESLANVQLLTANLCVTTARINALLERQVPDLVAHAENAAANLDTLSAQLKEADIATILAEASEALKSANTTLSKLEQSDNTVGKLLNTTELHDGLTQTMGSLDSLINDIQAHPKRYINISVFGGKEK